ncbi:MAG TPA: helix-turn-helix transcriptional regulator [Acidimicrobiales bacterium]|nr:helix-turn-helix transcriptional regulator [Acidimicrobiales bacterium]
MSLGAGEPVGPGHSPDEQAILVALGLAIGRRRVQRGLAQEEASRRCGFHRTYWGAIERGRRNVPLLTLMRIAEVLHCTPADLIEDAGL